MMYRLRVFSPRGVVKEVFHNDLGHLHSLVELGGYYGQVVAIHETVDALDGPEVLGLVDKYIPARGLKDPLTGATRGPRGPLRGSP